MLIDKIYIYHDKSVRFELKIDIDKMISVEKNWILARQTKEAAMRRTLVRWFDADWSLTKPKTIIFRTVIKCINCIYTITTLFTYILGILSKQKGWHKTLPIPIQNVIVGIIVFILSLIIVHVQKEHISVENIIE